ncbi:adhesion G-protein coupled receptor G6-like isoform X2 [Anneissia japonica]|nr:adhesion G-protein coupled receptor G6-like isoform X2 [Anneissia japonica]
MSGAVIYSQVFVDKIINNTIDSRLHLLLDQPIKIISTSQYKITLTITQPTYHLNSGLLKVNSVTCTNGKQECRQFIMDWNKLISNPTYAECDDIDAQYRAAELCLGEFIGDPEVIRHPKSQMNNVGLTSILECNIRNVESYKWYKNNKRFPNSGPTYSLQLEEEQDQGDYMCLGFRSQDSKYITSNIATVLITGVSTFRVHVKFNISYKEGYNNSKSEVFKNFTRNLETALNGEILTTFKMLVTSITPGSVITEMELYFTDQPQNASAISVMINDSLLSLPEYETDPSYIDVMSISTCIGEDVRQGGILYSFPDASIGTTAESMQTCPLDSDKGISVSSATRYCGGNFVSGAKWSGLELMDCGIGNPSTRIQNIKEVEVTQNNAADIADALAIVTNSTASLDEASIMIVSSILEDIVELEIPEESVTLDVVEIVDNVIESILLETYQLMRETASSFVTSLERQLATVAAAGMNFTSVNHYVGVMTLAISSDALKKGLAYVELIDSDSFDDTLQPNNVKTFFEIIFPIDMVGASIALSPNISSISKAQTGDDEIRVYFTVYQNDSLFISNKLANESEESFTRLVGSHIISASIEAVKIDELVHPIKMAFFPRFETIHNTECVFWNSLDNGVGDWSNEGCTHNGTVDGREICLCDHLTNFAILVDYYEPKKSKFQDFLTISSLIGCIVSVVCLAFTIVTYLYFKQLRSKRPKKILINLSISLFFLNLVFAIGIEKTSSKNWCITIAALLHYFALASVFWMSIEALNMYLMFVKVFYDDIRYFMLKVCVVGYGAPLIIVAICLGIDINHYANENYCFVPSGNVRNFSIILVIGVLLLFNCVVFALVMRTLICGRKVAKAKRGILIKSFQNAIAVSVLIGLPWVFGFMAIDSDSSARDLFQALFSLFNSLQGLFIFLLFCVGQKDIRDAWKGCCKRGNRGSSAKVKEQGIQHMGRLDKEMIQRAEMSYETTGFR